MMPSFSEHAVAVGALLSPMMMPAFAKVAPKVITVASAIVVNTFFIFLLLSFVFTRGRLCFVALSITTAMPKGPPEKMNATTPLLTISYWDNFQDFWYCFRQRKSEYLVSRFLDVTPKPPVLLAIRQMHTFYTQSFCI